MLLAELTNRYHLVPLTFHSQNLTSWYSGRDWHFQVYFLFADFTAITVFALEAFLEKLS